MATSDLDEEYAALQAEHAALEAEHQRLEKRPIDLREHARHNQRLRDHIARLHRYMAARGLKVPGRKAKPARRRR